MTNTFYTYLWLRSDGSPYYVGKGKDNRAYAKHTGINAPPKERIMIYPAVSEADAFETEIALIWYYGRKDLGTGCLRNLTDGGDGPSGAIRSLLFRNNISAVLSGRKRSSLECNAISKGQKNSSSLSRRVENMAAKRRGVSPWNKGKTGVQKAWNRPSVQDMQSMVGKSFGRWTVFSLSKSRDLWCVCQCVCGTEREVSVSRLRNKISTSCGCARYLKGGHRNNAKLALADMLAIQKALAAGALGVQLAKQYQVCTSTISNIKRRKP
jgi:hypothetical protein